MNLEDLTQAALELPLPERLRLAGLLLQSDEEEEDLQAVEAAWEVEITKRVKAVEEGRDPGVPWEEVLDRQRTLHRK